MKSRSVDGEAARSSDGMSRGFVIRATKKDGSVSWLARPGKHVIRALGPLESAATFATAEEAEAEIDCAAAGYATAGVTLDIEPAD